MAYNQVILDNMAGTTVGTQLVSVRIATKSGTYTEVALDNGKIVLLDGLKSGEREIYWGIVPARDSAKTDVVLIASVEELYDERKYNLSDFTNAAGTNARGYHFNTGDVFTLTAGCFSNAANDAPIVGDIVELEASNLFKAVTSLTSGSTKIGTIHEVSTVSGIARYTVKVS